MSTGAARIPRVEPSPSRATDSRCAVASNEVQALEPAVVVGLDRQRIYRAGADTGPRRSVLAQEVERLGIVYAEAGQDAADGVAAAHAFFAPIAGFFGVDDGDAGCGRRAGSSAIGASSGAVSGDEAEGGCAGDRRTARPRAIARASAWRRPPRGRANAMG